MTCRTVNSLFSLQNFTQRFPSMSSVVDCRKAYANIRNTSSHRTAVISKLIEHQHIRCQSQSNLSFSKAAESHKRLKQVALVVSASFRLRLWHRHLLTVRALLPRRRVYLLGCWTFGRRLGMVLAYSTTELSRSRSNDFRAGSKATIHCNVHARLTDLRQYKTH